jgi:hypothetical protein
MNVDSGEMLQKKEVLVEMLVFYWGGWRADRLREEVRQKQIPFGDDNQKGQRQKQIRFRG